jgi:hypothetical protein
MFTAITATGCISPESEMTIGTGLSTPEKQAEIYDPNQEFRKLWLKQ